MRSNKTRGFQGQKVVEEQANEVAEEEKRADEELKGEPEERHQ